MTRQAAIAGLGALALAACQANHAPGNDAEAGLDPPAVAALRASSGEVLAHAERDALQPETLDDADVRSLGAAGRCRFLFSRDAFPSFAFGDGAGVVKLSGTLVPLHQRAPGRFAADGLDVQVTPLQDQTAAGSLRRAQMVMQAAGARGERGYRGWVDCAS